MVQLVLLLPLCTSRLQNPLIDTFAAAAQESINWQAPPRNLLHAAHGWSAAAAKLALRFSALKMLPTDTLQVLPSAVSSSVCTENSGAPGSNLTCTRGSDSTAAGLLLHLQSPDLGNWATCCALLARQAQLCRWACLQAAQMM